VSAVFLTAEWRDLVMLNYEIDPQVLLPLVPRGTELDPWNGRHFVSVVGFRFLQTRVLGVPIPGHRNFEEVNLRFYVRRDSSDGPRRAVVFIKELVPRRAIARLARLLYNENYFAMPMKHAIDQRSTSFSWQRAGCHENVALEPGGERYVPDEASEEAFITEHYWGYTRQRDGGTIEYQVEHPRWTVRRAVRATLSCDVGELYGREFAPFLAGEPCSAFLADGSAVLVRRGVRLSV
jgi:uncharacterized protein YqjF (DUF2071 family)